MQLNSGWYSGNWQDPETNIRAGCLHLKWLMDQPGMNEWAAVVAYNCGLTRFRKGPPASSVAYACRVFERRQRYQGYKW
jgi:soluble lytic murein transglycosylase-like protein